MSDRIDMNVEDAVDKMYEYSEVINRVTELVKKISDELRKIGDPLFRGAVAMELAYQIIESCGGTPLEVLGYIEVSRRMVEESIVAAMKYIMELVRRNIRFREENR